MKTNDPFRTLLHSGKPAPVEGMRVTRIAVMIEVWGLFKARCEREHISPSEQLHHLMREWLE